MGMKQFFQRPKDYSKNLREMINLGQSTETLQTLPDRFASIIERYEAIDTAEPAFRKDVYSILSGACDVAEAMVDTTFPVEEAGTSVAEMMQVLARVLLYIQSRPTAEGYSLLLPEKKELSGQYNTQAEAENARLRLVSLGISHNCLVVPIRMISKHAIQPRVVAKPLDPENPPIPKGIIPVRRLPLAPTAAELLPAEPPPPSPPTSTRASVPFTFPTEGRLVSEKGKRVPTISISEVESRTASLEEQLRALQDGEKKP